ncbi:uncharacterized protein LOC128709269 [Anopheles marshallii]|uniref:uncharacterized protein LOC128709269 n=1 Tax=Anopheles marshallii TaxID=1521116 RepID=UPI00237BBFB2|nr:uncharacterized protein LOC128709269 [Anopheles marshallii]
MNSPPLSNDERHYRNQLWCERIKQQQPQYNPSRLGPDERVTLNDEAGRVVQRPTSSCLPEHRRRGQGLGRPHREHPVTRLSHPVGDCTETDGEMDDTLSEFAGGWYSPRRHRSRTSTMRPSTWKKLNQWLDAHQQVRNEGMEKVQSMTELRFAEYNSSEEETSEQCDAAEKHKNVEQEPDEASQAPSDVRPESSDASRLEVPPPKDKSIGIGYQLLKNFMLLLLYIIETLLPLTFPLLAFLKNRMKAALVYLWVRFIQPIMTHGPQVREDPLSMVIMLLVLPLVGVLGVCYCVVCILYWLHRLFLIEP